MNDALTTAQSSAIQTVIDFWFLDAETGRLDVPQPKRWFNGGEELDRAISLRFAQNIEQAANGELDAWQKTAQGALALIVLLDQFNRNIHRGTARAFAHDHKALEICHAALAQQFDRQLPLTQQVFLYLPLEHDESMQSQNEALLRFEKLASDAPMELSEFAAATHRSAVEHHEIIQQFGRYPHRNAVLGRQHTEEEQAWLDNSGKRFGQ